MEAPENSMSIVTASKKFNVSKQTLYQAISDGKLEVSKVGNRSYVTSEQAQVFLQTRKSKNTKPKRAYVRRRRDGVISMAMEAPLGAAPGATPSASMGGNAMVVFLPAADLSQFLRSYRGH